jgi:hypothetical protein
MQLEKPFLSQGLKIFQLRKELEAVLEAEVNSRNIRQ